MADLTEITHKVTVGGRETTILAEFQKQVGGQPTTTPHLARLHRTMAADHRQTRTV